MLWPVAPNQRNILHREMFLWAMTARQQHLDPDNLSGSLFLAEYFEWRPRRRSVFDRLATLALQRARIPGKVATAAAFDNLVNSLTRRFKVRRSVEPVAGIYSGAWTNIERRMNIYHLADQVLSFGVPGDVVEVGCNSGETAVLLQTLVQRHDPSRRLHVYDSFEGLPAPSARDTVNHPGRGLPGWARAGSLDVAVDALRLNFKRYMLPAPEIHKGWFKDTLPVALPEKIALAHLDGDFYESILVSLVHVYPRLSPRAICLIDDYCDPAANPDGWDMLPGVKRACDEFLADKPEKIQPLYAGAYSHGFFRKL